MKYEDGYLIMEEADVNLLTQLKLKKIEKSYEANHFLFKMADYREGLTEHLNCLAARNDKNRREELQVEILELSIQVCDICSKRAREAVADSGAHIMLN